jgi:hypothetical protein
MSSCVLLGGAEFLQHYGQMLVGVLCNLMANLSDDGIPLLFPIFEVTLQLFPAEGAVLLDPALQQLFALCLSGYSSTRVPPGRSTLILDRYPQNRMGHYLTTEDARYLQAGMCEDSTGYHSALCAGTRGTTDDGYALLCNLQGTRRS